MIDGDLLIKKKDFLLLFFFFFLGAIEERIFYLGTQLRVA
jgi:hypothetical protein